MALNHDRVTRAANRQWAARLRPSGSVFTRTPSYLDYTNLLFPDFAAAVDEYEKTLTRGDLDLLHTYQSSGYLYMNDSLVRQVYGKETDRLQQLVTAAPATPAPITAYRGLRLRGVDDIRAFQKAYATGRRLFMNGFLSVTFDVETALGFAKGGEKDIDSLGVLFVIHAPAGVRGYIMRFGSDDDESEWVLPHGTTLDIGKMYAPGSRVEHIYETGPDVMVIRARIVPQKYYDSYANVQILLRGKEQARQRFIGRVKSAHYAKQTASSRANMRRAKSA